MKGIILLFLHIPRLKVYILFSRKYHSNLLGKIMEPNDNSEWLARMLIIHYVVLPSGFVILP